MSIKFVFIFVSLRLLSQFILFLVIICKQNWINMKYILSDIWFFKIEIKRFLQLTNFESGVSLFEARKYALF